MGNAISIAEGSKEKVQLQGEDASGNPVTLPGIVYSTDSAAVATVAANPDGSGTVTAVAPGSTTLRATAADGLGDTSSLTVTAVATSAVLLDQGPASQ